MVGTFIVPPEGMPIHKFIEPSIADQYRVAIGPTEAVNVVGGVEIVAKVPNV